MFEEESAIKQWQCLLHKFTQKHKLTEQLQGHMYSNSKQFTICFSTLWTLVFVASESNSWFMRWTIRFCVYSNTTFAESRDEDLFSTGSIGGH